MLSMSSRVKVLSMSRKIVLVLTSAHYEQDNIVLVFTSRVKVKNIIVLVVIYK